MARVDYDSAVVSVVSVSALWVMLLMISSTGGTQMKKESRTGIGTDLLKTIQMKHSTEEIPLSNEEEQLDLFSEFHHRHFNNLQKTLNSTFTLYISIKEDIPSSNWTIFGVYSKNKSLPYLELLTYASDTDRFFALRYQGHVSYQRVTFSMTGLEWRQIMLWVDGNKIGLVVDCGSEVTASLRQPIIALPVGLQFYLGRNRQGQEKYQGVLLEARLFEMELSSRPWTCGGDALEKDMMLADDGGLSISGEKQRLSVLEHQVETLVNMVNMLKSQNTDLTKRVAHLERCECRSRCSYNGSVLQEGQTWEPDPCTLCVCRMGVPQCTMNPEANRCADPCLEGPCHHEGTCSMSPEQTDFECSCPRLYRGKACERRVNPCVWPPESGHCNQTLHRYYYDRFTQQCLSFVYTGCGGNMNNYETLAECERVSMRGACCYRQFTTSLASILGEDRPDKTNCKILKLDQCKEIHRQRDDDLEIEVVSYYPGLSCEEAGCFRPSTGCLVDNRTYNAGQTIHVGCDQCICEKSGLVHCPCANQTIRREIRDWNQEEIVRFQKAVNQLYLSGVWEEFRDVYMSHSMYHSDAPLFLPWNRLFLLRVERKLKEIDCSISLPYFDFTTDVSNFTHAVIWQPNYFGGDGEGDMWCVPDHRFDNLEQWAPCITRRFNMSVNLPTLLELSLAFQNEDFTEMSTRLETYSAYLHNFIGGDMATIGAAYDPVFFLIHAFIDRLYVSWQATHSSNKFKFPAIFGNALMAPFGIAPKDVLDSDQVLCVTYTDPSEGHPCNVTFFPPRQVNSSFSLALGGPYKLGYNLSGFDRRGYNRHGYNIEGYSRDGFDTEGYDVAGFDRLGYNRDGYSRFGFNLNNRDKEGNRDTSGRYSEEDSKISCLRQNGLTFSGRDQFGFTPEGYDVNFCNFSYHGPLSPIQSFRVWQVLVSQGQSFLKSLPRRCPGLAPLPQQWNDQFWIKTPKDVTGIVTVEIPLEPPTGPTARFCLDTDPYLSPCSCDVAQAACTENPCLEESCAAYPEALCQVHFCGECKATWHINGLRVDCHKQRDHCYPNPCGHGGLCVPSVWPQEPHLITCTCAPGYDGPTCEHKALEVCALPVRLGRCNAKLERWYFNPRTQTCEQFTYTGCHGNANNFPSFKACRSQCMIGACCCRSSRMPGHIHGYDLQGYDRYGYNIIGVNRQGKRGSVDSATAFGRQRFDKRGFDWRGFDKDGYDSEGYDHHGYSRSGYTREGFNLTGYSIHGEFDGIIDYNENSFDEEGYNRAGFDCNGYNRDDLNYEGLVGAYRHECRHMTLVQCQAVEIEAAEVVQFSPGQRCSEIECWNKCSCYHNEKKYKFGEHFKDGCETCVCSHRGIVECECSNVQHRKEIRDMLQEEVIRFKHAIRKVADGYPSEWYKVAELYARHKPQALGSPKFLPWNRFFVRVVERKMQAIDCNLTIPYFDWTMDVGSMEKSVVWAANMFGGNGESGTGCVKYHPFKDSFLPYWTPCLRRRFNVSVNLLDAVDIELILRQDSYNSFCLQLELASNLFQTWVGGHMISDLAPYDPLFLSHLAFIDKLWSEWQTRHPDNILQFPAELRYTYLSPFAVTPDDVMDTEKQMCVLFIPIGEGMPCNSSIPNFGFGKEGFDRHGFDREGYDRAGYNKSGFNHDGLFDNRTRYDINGFDRDGFSREGYDRMGLDRYGFSVTTFNPDGFDADGFDQLGFNRYGVDRKGIRSYGFYENETKLPTYTRLSGKIFDSYGFSRYGFNKYGFDHDGYDIFGYDSTGRNRAKCQHYFLGPLYLTIKRILEQKLRALDDTELKIIVRTCPGSSKVPEWIYTSNWLKRSDQIPLLREIELLLRQNRLQADKTGIQFSNASQDQLWFPQTPDQRFCFVTYQYSECPLGQLPISCAEDMCEERTCPGHPKSGCWTRGCQKCYADWYDGLTGQKIKCTGCVDEKGRYRGDNSTWALSDCQVCQCLRGNVDCSRIDCPPINCQHPVEIKGQCCPTCESGCDYKDKVYGNDVTFSPAGSPCEQCQCSHGNVTCGERPCPDIHNCIKPVTLEGDCCPICLECEGHPNGTLWQDAPCRTCTCVNGHRLCQRVVCPDLPCAHPYTPEDECCPVCVGCYFDGVIYQDGEEFQPSACAVCSCNQGDVRCVTRSCPPIRCEKPIQLQGMCCPICDAACEYEGTIYLNTEHFNPSYDPCLNCSCRNSLVQCSPLLCPSPRITCQTPTKKAGHCCATECPKCVHNSRHYEHGEIWTPTDSDCQICECKEGLISCTMTQPCGLECTHGVIPKGECCSLCRDCLYDGRVIPDGRYFSRPGDSCQQCMCHHGNIQCEVVDVCPRLPCTQTETMPGTCCPICKGCQYEGRHFRHEAMVPSDNSCTDCVCTEGEVECDPKPCPPLSCDTPKLVEGQCCPICTHCQYDGEIIQDRQTFIPDRNPCYSCSCYAGHLNCRQEVQCDAPACSHPSRVPGQCCLGCHHCDYQRRRFRNGQVFASPDRDVCQICICKDGSVTCRRVECSPVNCASAFIPPGHCCEICAPACHLQGREYPEGHTLDDPRDKCSTCVCKAGILDCTTKVCPVLSCSHPARMPDDCCPACNYCVYDRRLFRSGHTFGDPADRCKHCTCQAGSVTCERRPCLPVFCTDPEIKPGKCCPQCEPDTCHFLSQRFQQGQRFPNPRNPCEECVCDKGTVSCQKTPCLPISCSHPLQGDCCPSCDGCLFYDQEVDDGVSLANPYSPCERCICDRGTVTCLERQCDPVSCLNPVTVACCPSCTQCLYRGRQIRNGQTFPDMSERCQECQCTNGTVDCGPVKCRSDLPCQNPAQGECCLECRDCNFFDEHYHNGMTFQAPTNVCQECTCRNGNVACVDKVCPPMDCDNPVKGQCCPECKDCLYNNNRHDEEEKFPHLSDPCQECVCHGGNVRCGRRLCPNTICRNPVHRGCCDECSDCNYLQTDYRNGEKFDNSRDVCQLCECRDGNVRCQTKVCLPVLCSYPVKGQCCQECNGCLYQGQEYQNQQTFDDHLDPCKFCQCSEGYVECRPKICLRAVCSHPVEGRCCKECNHCLFEGVEYRHKQTFSDVQDPCKTCQCYAGNIKCRQKVCQRLTCTHPVKGECCRECIHCQYGDVKYVNRKTFNDPEDWCKVCECRDGSVTCHQKTCPRVTCNHPVQGKCCPECIRCLYEGVDYVNGKTFTHPQDSCQICQCQHGSVNCRQKVCPRVTCRHPLRGECCPECTHCFYKGVQYVSGKTFNDSQDLCKVCECRLGSVNCQQKVCPRASCSHPVEGACCPKCDGCLYGGIKYENGKSFADPQDSCKLCACRKGNVKCRQKVCPPLTCTHPVQGKCCRECQACLYEGVEYLNQQLFSGTNDPCHECHCLDGSILCQTKRCPSVTCTHPAVMDCCPKCSDCLFNGKTIRSSTEFPHGTNACQVCMCLRGSVKCRPWECPITYCTHPVQGTCCLECGGQCLFKGNVLESGQSISDQCQTCLCVKGNVQCDTTPCPMVTCRHPVSLPHQCCPDCSQCFYNSRRFTDGQIFADMSDRCKQCQCQSGTVTCPRKPCPAVTCEHPVPGECCPVCGSDCLYEGRRIPQGHSFPNREDECKTCSCRAGTVSCDRKSCDPVSCQHPVEDQCGCGQCVDCQYLGAKAENGQQFDHPADPCQTCRCLLGSVLCQTVACTMSCSHPSLINGCCPVCDQCSYDGQISEDGQQFTSITDPCQICSCQRGSVSCRRKVCLEPRCDQPVRREGQCCFECPVCQFYGDQYQDRASFLHPEDKCKKCTCSGGRVVCNVEPCVTDCSHPRPDPCCPVCDECYFEGQLIGNGQTFRPDPCRTCFCTKGDVVCEAKQCPGLHCLKKVTEPGECCPKCSGCMYEGLHYEEGTNWIPEENPCVSCMCNSGIITCDELSCLTMCDNHITVPGQCCPVCPTCQYNGVSYEDGDVFNPNGDPCDNCKCLEGHLRCTHETCPNVNHCPSEQIIPAKPGVCCPSCSGFGTNCTLDHIGMVLHPQSDDPCFYCECQESFNWICTKESCPPLGCPVSRQKAVPSQCCPQCPVCYVRRTGEYYHESEEWQEEGNPCITCMCKEGSVQCSIVDCPVVQCGPGEELVKPTDRCCEVCVKSRQANCLHHGIVHQAGDNWKPDECTSCRCINGKVRCTAEECPPLDCPAEEVPSISPGSCCPVCLAKPATCMVYGDPHYKTFDGTTYHFQGTCKYIMAADCEGGDFTVEVHHDDRGVEEQVSWAQNITVKIADITIDLLQKHVVKARGEEVSLPYFYEPYLYVERRENTVLLNTNLGVKVSWDGESYAELNVPGTYKRRTCGLCGNFNGFPQDDMRTKRGKITNSPAVFGNSWKVKGEVCEDAQDIDPCAKAGYRAKKVANIKCAVIKSDLFARCHRVISPEPYFSSCVFDMCVCAEETNCLCNVLASYAHECGKAGVKLQWRSHSLCAISCPKEKGFIFDECGPPCPRTCENRNTPLGNIEANCFKPCIPGCQCVAGKVVHDGKCISQSDCPNL